MSLLFLASVGVIAVIALMVVSILRAPGGYEDKEGFHYTRRD